MITVISSALDYKVTDHVSSAMTLCSTCIVLHRELKVSSEAMLLIVVS